MPVSLSARAWAWVTDSTEATHVSDTTKDWGNTTTDLQSPVIAHDRDSVAEEQRDAITDRSFFRTLLGRTQRGVFPGSCTIRTCDGRHAWLAPRFLSRIVADRDATPSPVAGRAWFRPGPAAPRSLLCEVLRIPRHLATSACPLATPSASETAARGCHPSAASPSGRAS